MYKKILIPLDGSKLAENALPLARCFARALQVPIELLSVVDIAEAARRVAADGIAVTRELADDANRRFVKYLEELAKRFPTGRVYRTVRKGNAADTIIATSASDPQTLIVMATHGRSGLDRWLLGSVTEKVLRSGDSPLLIVRAKEDNSPPWEMAAPKRLLVPLDGSELAERILPYVQHLAKHLDLEVMLIGVYGSPVAASAGGEGFYDATQLHAFIAELRAEKITYLGGKTEELKWHGLKNVSFVAKEGLAPDEIIACSRANPDTLIAMCSHGRSGVKRWLLGSVTETVVRHSEVPVLVVRSS
jgi:nucleotide-binding universal stress UspA family protein